jgi:hypothetical protein
LTFPVSPFVRYTAFVMAPREITPAQAFAMRIEKRMQTLRAVSEDGYTVAISELDIVARQVRKAQQYFVSRYTETTVRPRK